MKATALVMKPTDNVATALVDLKEGSTVQVKVGGETHEVLLREDVPFGFKFALRHIEAGQRVIKYGEAIGVARVGIEPGLVVHIHNTDGTRGRGDLT